MIHKLPELPEGYFWRIKEIYLFSTPLVTIRRKVLWWSEEVISRGVTEPTSEESWEGNTLRAARTAKEEFLESNRYRLFINKVEGDYPPKKAEDW